MAESKNLMGLNLNVDSDLIAEAVKESIIAGIAAGLNNKEQIIQEFVKASLTERVLVEDGSKPRGSSSEKTCSRMEYNVRSKSRNRFSEILSGRNSRKSRFRASSWKCS